MRKIVTVFLIIGLAASVAAQEKSKTKVTADLVSSYIWRGIPGFAPLGEQHVLAPGVQPGLAWTWKNLEVGTWGSVDFTGTYKEVDLYASYSIEHFTVSLTDYYWDLEWLKKNYFDYDDETTSHLLEGSLLFKKEGFPLSLMAATMIYGADKKPEDVTKNNYSTYVELGYSLPAGSSKFDLALGITPGDGLYGDGYGGVEGFSVVNLSVTGYRSIQISDKVELPLKASLIANPQQSKIYLVFTLSI